MINYGLKDGELIDISSTRGFNFEEGQKHSDDRKLFISKIDAIQVVKEYDRYIVFKIFADDFRKAYCESINKADILGGDAYFKVVKL